MTRMVQVAVAGDVTEAEELESILQAAGIDTQLEAGALVVGVVGGGGIVQDGVCLVEDVLVAEHADADVIADVAR